MWSGIPDLYVWGLVMIIWGVIGASVLVFRRAWPGAILLVLGAIVGAAEGFDMTDQAVMLVPALLTLGVRAIERRRGNTSAAGAILATILTVLGVIGIRVFWTGLQP